MLEKLGDDGKTADDDTRCKLSICPKAHLNHVVSYIWRCNHLPGVVRPQDGRNTSAARSISGVLEILSNLVEICVVLHKQNLA